MRRALALLGAAAALVGCVSEVPRHVELWAITGAPPSRTVELHNRDGKHAIVVSAGVAFAVSASDNCPPVPTATPEPPRLTIADPTVLEAHLLARSPARREWLLVAKKVGATTVVVTAACATQSYEVSVRPPPGAPQTPAGP